MTSHTDPQFVPGAGAGEQRGRGEGEGEGRKGPECRPHPTEKDRSGDVGGAEACGEREYPDSRCVPREERESDKSLKAVLVQPRRTAPVKSEKEKREVNRNIQIHKLSRS